MYIGGITPQDADSALESMRINSLPSKSSFSAPTQPEKTIIDSQLIKEASKTLQFSTGEIDKVARRLVASVIAKAVQRVIMEGTIVS